MKKIVMILLVASFFSMITVNAFAGGDKNHGDKGKGAVKRIMVKK